MIRTFKRWFSTDETKQLAKDVDELADRLLDYGHKVEGMQLRIERHLNKLRMQDTRAAARESRSHDQLSPEEREVIEDLRRGGGEVPPGRDPFYQ